MRMFDIRLWLGLDWGRLTGTRLIHALDAHGTAGGLINFD